MVADNYFEELLSDEPDTPQSRKALAGALRRQDRYALIGTLMNEQPTLAMAKHFQNANEVSLKGALAKQQAAKEAAAEQARQAVLDARDQRDYNQRNDAIEATRADKRDAQMASGQIIDTPTGKARVTPDNRAIPITDASGAQVKPAPKATSVTDAIKLRAEQEKYIGALASANDMLKTLGEAYNHPGRTAATGGSWAAGYIPGTSARDYRLISQKLQGGAFLQAYNMLRGSGQITEQEGDKATKAMTILGDLSASEEAHAQALQDFYSVISDVRDRMKYRVNELKVAEELVDTTDPQNTPTPIPGSQPPAQPDAQPRVPRGTEGAPIAIYDAQGRRVQ